MKVLVFVLACLCATLTFGRQEVDKQPQGGEEDTGDEDVDDVEEGFPLDDEEEHHFLVLQLVPAVARIDQLLSWPVPDHPLPILWNTQGSSLPSGNRVFACECFFLNDKLN